MANRRAVLETTDVTASLFSDADEALSEALGRVAGYVPLTRYDDTLKLLESCISDLIQQRNRLHASLLDILDAAERARAGFPIESEEWYARRDYARIQVGGSK